LTDLRCQWLSVFLNLAFNLLLNPKEHNIHLGNVF